MDDDTDFLLKRAQEEAALAISSENEDAASVHQELAVRYSAKALLKLQDED